MDLLKEILMQNNIKGVFFVPMREQINTNGILPSAPKGLKTCRGNNKYKKLLSTGPDII
jgi:hypothetical protein